MRSTQRDVGSVSTFTGKVADAASGVGLFMPDQTPFTYTRDAVGQYSLRFDTRIVPVGILAISTTNLFIRLYGFVPGLAILIALDANGATFSADFLFTMTARDLRT